MDQSIEVKVGKLEERTEQIRGDISDIKEGIRSLPELLNKSFTDQLRICRRKHRKACPINKEVITANPSFWPDVDTLKRALIGLGIIGSLIGSYYGLSGPNQPQVPQIPQTVSGVSK